MRSARPSPLTSPAPLTELPKLVTGAIANEGVERGAIKTGENPCATAIVEPLLSSNGCPDNEVGESITVDIPRPTDGIAETGHRPLSPWKV